MTIHIPRALLLGLLLLVVVGGVGFGAYTYGHDGPTEELRRLKATRAAEIDDLRIHDRRIAGMLQQLCRTVTKLRNPIRPDLGLDRRRCERTPFVHKPNGNVDIHDHWIFNMVVWLCSDVYLARGNVSPGDNCVHELPETRRGKQLQEAFDAAESGG